MDCFIGEIRLLSYNRVPDGWHLCDGSLLSVNQYQALYSLIGNTFGGNVAQNTFGLPDLRGRTPVGQDVRNANYIRGISGGTESVTVTQAQFPAHNHSLAASTQVATVVGTKNAFYAQPPAPDELYASPSSPAVAIADNMLNSAGGNAAHDNMQPYQAQAFFIALTGVYPTRP